MRLIYNISIFFVKPLLRFVGLFNSKIKLGVIGRSETFSIIKSNLSEGDKTLWFHCASLGEYEQGLPIFKELRAHYNTHKIILTFFSPSGYEIKKDTDVADIVAYLPLDTKKQAREFIDLVNPELTVFVKYDIWPNYLLELKKRNAQAILISALFREKQSFFKFYGGFMRSALFTFEHIFVQNEASKSLLKTINYKNVTITGDTRFDRVFNQLAQNNTLPFLETFKDNHLCLVAGSTWPEDEAILTHLINSSKTKTIKYVIAPHNIKLNQINKLKESINKKTILFSEIEGKNLSEYDVLILDTIGLLSKAYDYADVAYVGGAIGNTGLHNTLEPAVFGVPIIIGNHYQKFPEAEQMITNGGMFSISNSNELNEIFNKLSTDSDFLKQSGESNLKYIKKNKGAVIQIADYLRI